MVVIGGGREAPGTSDGMTSSRVAGIYSERTDFRDDFLLQVHLHPTFTLFPTARAKLVNDAG